MRAVLAVVLLAAGPAGAAELVVKDRNFAVVFPVPAKAVPLPTPQNARSAAQWVAESGGNGFVVIAVDWNPGNIDPDLLFDGQRDAMIAQAGALVGDTYVSREGRPGRELRLKGAQGAFVSRLFLDPAAHRSYNVLASNTTGVETPDLARFVRSFRFLDTPSPQAFSSLEDGVSVTFPAPARTTQEETPQGPTTSSATQVDGTAYMLMVLRSKSAFDGDPQVRLDGARDGALARVREGRLVSEKRLQVAGRPARELEIDAAGGERLHSRIVLDPKKGRLYMLILGARAPRMDRAKATAFFESFRILD